MARPKLRLNGPRLPLAPSQALSCFRSYLLSQIGEPGRGAEILNECRQAQQSLNTLAATHHNLALSLGGTADSAKLRKQLQDVRTTVQQQSAAVGSKLMLLLSGTEGLKPEEWVDLERAWLLFAWCMELFRRDLQQVRRLRLLFPLDAPGRFLTSTGVTCDLSGPNEQSAELGSGEEPGLDVQIADVGRMLGELEVKVQAPAWRSEATEEPWAEVNSIERSDSASSDGLTEGEAEMGRGCNCGGSCTIS